MCRRGYHLALFTLLFGFGSSQVVADEVRFYVVWGLRGGAYHGELTVSDGEFVRVDPWQWESADELNMGPRHVTWIGNVYNGTDGLVFTARGSAKTTFRLRFTSPHRADVTFRWADVLRRQERRIPLSGFDFAAYGSGDIRCGPRQTHFVEKPALYEPPTAPTQAVTCLPDDWWKEEVPLSVRLSDTPSGTLRARRVADREGRLLVQLLAESPLTGTAQIRFGAKTLATVALDGPIWLSVPPRIRLLDIEVKYPAGKQSLQLPTTLIQVSGSRLLVNGEPFLVKGSLPRGLNDRDAAFLKSLGANTLRMRPDEQVSLLARHGFMVIASCHTGPGRMCGKDETEQAFEKNVATYRDNSLPLVREIASHPHALILQIGNEQVTGQDPWLSRMKPPHSFERLDYLLATLYNAVKPIEPMLPIGYSNCAFGYIAPDFLDVYLHNTYLGRDRDWPPIEEFMALQNCAQRPYIHTEFGANAYMPQLYLRGPNSPVLEKIHAWNYSNRWATYQAAGTQGGTNYCLYDYDYSKVNRGSWDKGFTNFGIMTFTGSPKLACWELNRLWRDFDVTPTGAKQLQLQFHRDYAARQCRLTLQVDSQDEYRYELADFEPHSSRQVDISSGVSTFRWRLDYTTHGGLVMQARGAWPPAIEEADFLERLQQRDTYPFLKELFDAQVMTVDGRPAPPTLRDMERADGVVPIAFRKRNGVVYVTAFSRAKPNSGWYQHDIEIDIAFAGHVTAVDELTGEPKRSSITVRQTPTGVQVSNLRVPYLPPQYTHRAAERVSLPVLRISPKTEFTPE